jgi:hypothetical protein
MALGVVVLAAARVAVEAVLMVPLVFLVAVAQLLQAILQQQ